MLTETEDRRAKQRASGCEEGGKEVMQAVTGEPPSHGLPCEDSLNTDISGII